MNDPLVSVVIPCLNEEKTIGICIEKAQKAFLQNNLAGEVIVADNGSCDKSVSISKDKGAIIINVEGRGYGSALRAGIQHAKGKYIIMGDGDDSYDFLKINDLIEKLNEGFDLVVGNRFKGKICKGAMPFLHRYLGNPVLSFIGRLFFKVSIKDFHCGLRAFTKDAYQKMKLQCNGMEFASEMIVKASLKKLKITEIPVVLHKDGRERKSHLRTWRDGWKHLVFLLLFSPRWLFLYPGLFLFFLSTFLFIAISLSPSVFFNGIIFDIQTLLYIATMIFISYQTLFFFFTTDYLVSAFYGYSKETRFTGLLRYWTIENGLLSGLFFLLFGLALVVYAFYFWYTQGFGPLSPSRDFRIAIPAAFSLIIGAQTILNSFFMGCLQHIVNREISNNQTL